MVRSRRAADLLSRTRILPGCVALSVGAMVGTVVASSWIYQAVAERRDRRRFPPPGRLVDIGGRRLHLWTHGSGSPTVVVVTCHGGTSLGWVKVLRALTTDTTTALYDRGGLGWSDPVSWPRTAGGIADELHQLFKAAAVPAPYVMVGHSLGGLIVRMYAARHHENLAALVLVDASHEDQYCRLALVDPRFAHSTLKWGLRYLLNVPGLARAVSTLRPRTDAVGARRYPPDLVDAATALDRTTRGLRASAYELLGFSAGAREVRATAGHLGDVPLTVITAADTSADITYPTWMQLQNELAELSNDSIHLVAEHAGHFVQDDDLDLVVGAIRGAVARGREYWRRANR